MDEVVVDPSLELDCLTTPPPSFLPVAKTSDVMVMRVLASRMKKPLDEHLISTFSETSFLASEPSNRTIAVKITCPQDRSYE